MTTLAAAPASALAAANSRQLFTRDDIIRLAQQGRPWQALPLALQALRAEPGDHALRFLAAASFAQLGLRTPARGLLAQLPMEIARDPGVQRLLGEVESLADDRVSVEERRIACRANVEAMVGAGVLGSEALAAALPEWEAHATRAGEAWCRARDGNIVVQRGEGGAHGVPDYRLLTDFIGQVAAIKLPHEATGTTNIRPYVVEGADPPWLLQRVLRATPDQADGYRVRVSLVQRSIMELLDGLSMVDLRAELATDRLVILVGDDASARLERDLLARTDTIVHGHYLGVPPRSVEWGAAGRCEPQVDQVVQRVMVAQQAEAIRLEAAVRVEYAARDMGWYARRFADRTRPLRVLVPTCRYSTYIRHAAADLVGAFEDAGCRARTLIEPDDRSQLASTAYLRAVAEFKPDLVVLINYTRANIGAVIPAGVPVVTWVQDAMPHLFDQRTGEAMGGLDFVVGHTHLELYERFGFPARNGLKLPVTASTRKFHDGPVDGALSARLACEVAFITHHSETPERMHARLCSEASHSPAVVRIFEELRPRIASMVERCAEEPLMPALRAAAEELTRRALGRDPDERSAAAIRNQYAFPMADRMIRHRVLEWAAEACDRRGWRLRLFGRGWQQHERFGAHAGPELAHGDDLRAAYQAAAATIHASAHWMYHQRVMECALSGGLPLVLLKADDLSLLRSYAMMRLAQASAGETMCAAECAEAMAFVAQLQRLGLPVNPVWGAMPRRSPAVEAARRLWGGMPEDAGAAFLLGDLSRTTFSTAAQFEERLAEAVENRAARADLSRGIAGRARRHYATERAAQSIIELVRSSLS